MFWNDLVKLALLGTDRSQLSEAQLNELQQLGIDTSQAAPKLLLEAAALMAPMQKAGQALKSWTGPLPRAAEEEEEQRCSARSAYHLAQIITKEKEVLLQDFLDILHLSGRSLPPEQLPALLERALQSSTFWEKLRPVLGQKGNWLIRQHPEWKRLVELPPLKLWEEGKREERRLLLESLRRQQPEKGLEILQETWPSETPNDKAKFIDILQIGLSELDEDFLEGCLDDRRKEVRRAAAKLLRRLPESRLVGRMKERLHQHFTVKRKGGKKIKLEVQPPEEVDEEMKRDGIDIKLRWPRGGLKASRLWQIMSAVPPAFWPQSLELEEAEVLSLFAKNEWRELLVQALVDATHCHPSTEWRNLLVTFWIEHYGEPRWFDLNVKSLLEELPDQLPDEIMLPALRKIYEDIDAEDPISELLQMTPKRWSKELSLLVLKRLEGWIIEEGSGYQLNYHYRNILKNAALAIPPHLYPKLKGSWKAMERQYRAWEQDIFDFLAMLSFRQRMYEEIERSEGTESTE
ncbi:MAG: DUF5691 domain-containing protein [Bacteroidota bacterium]